MSLWAKPVAEITAADVQAFYELQIPEGVNVDYKRDIPANNPAKLFASFANTTGGILILGVDTNEQNLPILPIRGMTEPNGLADRITNICRNILPPLLPSVGPVLELPGTTVKVAVVRIDQSYLFLLPGDRAAAN